MIGETISHYHIVAELGAGGMGVVYQAHDERLDRDVAIKVLSPGLALDPDRLGRFEREARAVAALTHPNIVTIHSVEETDGVHFLTMELVKGKTLTMLLPPEGFPLDRFFDLAIPLADAVNGAHSRGIIHRDLKPANIMIDDDGRLKVLDFGLAKLFDPGIGTSIADDEPTIALVDPATVEGSVLGTPDYMSPEQAEGKPVDHRTDLFALGVILYQMITGRHPFKGDSPASTISSILRDTPVPLTDMRSELPRHLGRIVGHCLAKDTDRRYQSALDLRNELEGLKRETESAAPGDGRGAAVVARGASRGRNRLRNAAFTIVAVAAIALGAWRLWPGAESPDAGGDPGRKMIAVLPFENLGPADEEYFSDGITEAITARLASIKELGVISRQSAISYKGSTKTIRQIGDELGVDYILEGTIQREKPGDPASRVRVIPQLVRVSDDTHVWAMTYDEDMTEVFRVQSEIAERVASQLDITLLGSELQAVDKRPTENLDAYDFYLRALDYGLSYVMTDNETAVELLQRAVSLDPDFAEAWAQLAMAYHSLHWVWGRPGILPLETEAAARARELAPDIQETRLALGYVEYAQRRFELALEHFEAAQDLRPGAEPLMAMGFTLRRMGRWQEAVQRFEEALPLAPRHYAIQYDGLGNTCVWMKRYEEAERHFDRAIALAPDVADAYLDKANLLVARDGDLDGAKQVLRKLSRRSNIAEASEAGQGHVQTYQIRLFFETYSEAYDALEAGPIERYRQTQPSMIASVHLGRALVYGMEGNQRAAVARYDSARAGFERVIRSNPQSAYISFYHSDLGLALAGLGQCEEAIRQGQEGVRLLPVSKDAVVGDDLIQNLAEIYVMCGEHAAAIDLLEQLCVMQSIVTPGMLRVDPIWDPLRDDPRFQALLVER